MYLERIENLRSQFAEDNLEAVFIVHRENRRYLSGFTGSGGSLLISRERNFLLTDSRYHLQVKKEAPDFELIDVTSEFQEPFSRIVNEGNIERLGFESHYLPFRRYRMLERLLKGTELIPVTGLVENLRSIKNNEELEFIVRAQDITDSAFCHIRSCLKESSTEQEVAWGVEKYMRENGAEAIPFPPIVASGTNAAEPHHKSSDKKIEEGEMVILDFGAMVSGYCSDMTRTVFLGEPDEKQAEMYELVLCSQETALKNLRAGAIEKDIDKAAREIIESKGLGESFRHGLGHGVGLEAHEKPTLSSSRDELLRENMVCTVEPGIYLPGWGGIRIEDMALIGEDGARVLTKSPKELNSVVI